MATVGIEELRSLVLAALGDRFTSEHAAKIADVVLFGELAGRPSHGILRVLPGSFGVMDEEPGPPPTVERIGPSAGRVAGRPGILVAALATELAAELAGETGFAVVTTRGSRSTSGSLAYFVEKLTLAGLVSFVSAGTVAFVTVPGSSQRVLGTNPLAVGLPAKGRPFILDMATSAIAGGDVLTAVADGVDLPEGVAVDSSGDPT
ncbi:MAG: Ldh family oxidoreductase, partial [Acidimicrobiia bacterium]